MAQKAINEFVTYQIPFGIDQYNIITEENAIDPRPIIKILKQKHYTEMREKWNKYDPFRESKDVDIPISNEPFKKWNNNSNFLLKLRNRRLNGCVEMRQKISKKRTDYQNERLKALYPSDKCPFCLYGPESTLHIIGLCPRWDEYRTQICRKAEQIIEENSNVRVQLQPWFLTSKDFLRHIEHDDILRSGSLGYFPVSIRNLLLTKIPQKQIVDFLCSKIHNTTLSIFKHIYKVRCKEYIKYCKEVLQVNVSLIQRNGNFKDHIT